MVSHDNLGNSRSDVYRTVITISLSPVLDDSRGALKQVRRYFTLYFIPIIPLDVAGRFVECQSCGGSFAEEVLSYDPEKARRETQTQMLRVMVMSALADGEVDAVEREEVNKQFTEIAGRPPPAATLDEEIAWAATSGADLNSFVGAMSKNLTPHGKALVVKLAFHTMSASGTLRPGHQEQLSKLSDTLSIPQEQYMALITKLSEPEVGGNQ